MLIAIRNLAKTAKPKSRSIDRFLPRTQPKVKEWEKRGVDKDEFFRKKYSFMSDDRRKGLDKKISRQNRYKELRNESKREIRPYKGSRESKDGESTGRRDTDRYSENKDNDRYSESRSRYSESRNRYRERENTDPDRLPLNKTHLYDYIYGTHAVTAALKANKRSSFHRIIVQNSRRHEDIIGMSKKYGVKVEERNKNDLNILTNNGVHNGIVLETRNLEFPTINKLGNVDSTYDIEVWNQYYSSSKTITKSVARPNGKYPFAIYLDEITDPQNIGAIIRSAYYLGVDFVVTPSYNSARLGAVAAKASAGALDIMDIYQVDNGLKFMRGVTSTQWKIVATDLNPGSKNLELSQAFDLAAEAPVLLVLGSEGDGVRTNLKNLSDFMIKIDQNRVNGDGLINSMNVNAATSILLSKFLLH